MPEFASVAEAEAQGLATVAAALAADPIEAAIQSWFNQFIANSPVSRNVDAINHLTSHLPALVAALKAS